MGDLPTIYVWCNSCEHEWHVAEAMAEDGTFLASHVCSSHGFIHHDMGVDENGWKRDLYAKHYPEGFQVHFVENPRQHRGLMDAYERHKEAAKQKEASDDKR